jgi:hypothetical protein
VLNYPAWSVTSQKTRILNIGVVEASILAVHYGSPVDATVIPKHVIINIGC